MKLAFFDTKPYDIPGFDRYAVPAGIEIKYFEYSQDHRLSRWLAQAL